MSRELKEEAEKRWRDEWADAHFQWARLEISLADLYYVGGYLSYFLDPTQTLPSEKIFTNPDKTVLESWSMGNADARGDWGDDA